MENNRNQIPPEVLKAIENADVYPELEKIGDRYGLLLDQLGDLDILTRKVLLGKLKANEYVDGIAKTLEISNQTASKIGVDVNFSIFLPLRDTIRKMSGEPEPATEPAPAIPKPPIAPIEKAGSFTVEQRDPSASPLYNDQTLTKEDVLADLENIKNLKPENAENYVEHLIANPVPPPPLPTYAPTPPKTPIPKQEPPQPEQKKYSADPYREPI